MGDIKEEGRADFLSGKAKRRVRQYTAAMFDLAVDNIRVKWNISPEDWNPTFELHWKGDQSLGWKDGILIVFNPEGIFEGGRFYTPEYPHIAKDPEIGSFSSEDWRPVILSLIAHELAHSVNILMYPDTIGVKVNKNNYDGNHGKKWQDIYRWISRNGFTPGKRKKEADLRIGD